MIIELKDDAGKRFVIQEGESMDIELKLPDMDGLQLTNATLLSMELTLYDETLAATDLASAIINSRTSQDVLGANDGVVAADGTFTMKLGPDDAVIMASTEPDIGAEETHIARFVWTWNDGVVRTGIAEIRFRVERLAD